MAKLIDLDGLKTFWTGVKNWVASDRKSIEDNDWIKIGPDVSDADLYTAIKNWADKKYGGLENMPNGASFSGYYFSRGIANACRMVYAMGAGGASYTPSGVFTGYLAGLDNRKHTGTVYRISLDISSGVAALTSTPEIIYEEIEIQSDTFWLTEYDWVRFKTTLDSGDTVYGFAMRSEYSASSYGPSATYVGCTMDGKYTLYHHNEMYRGTRTIVHSITPIADVVTESEIDEIFNE